MANETVLLKLKNLAYRLSIYILDFDVNTTQMRRSFLIHKINAVVQGMGRVLRESYAELPPELKERFESLDRGVSKWIFLRSQFLSLSEKWSVALLSFASIIAFLIATNRSPNWYADLTAIALDNNGFYPRLPGFRSRCKSQRNRSGRSSQQADATLAPWLSALRPLRTHSEADLRG